VQNVIEIQIKKPFIGIGPVAWFISTELVNTSASSRVLSLSISAQYFTCFLCPVIYSPLEELTGAFSFLLFIIPLSLSSIYFYKCLPETRKIPATENRAFLEGVHYPCAKQLNNI
ncbi:unnamed protein product, partial [Dracunculus medinensis]|uniref:MFS domain-containing protein n=1 Tax=Dracunculus medinensis TaxID=318479 RepID=A0A0N4UML0_DRAME